MNNVFNDLSNAQALSAGLNPDEESRLRVRHRGLLSTQEKLLNPTGSPKTKKLIEEAREAIYKEIRKENTLWRKLYDKFPCSRITST